MPIIIIKTGSSCPLFPADVNDLTEDHIDDFKFDCTIMQYLRTEFVTLKDISKLMFKINLRGKKSKINVFGERRRDVRKRQEKKS